MEKQKPKIELGELTEKEIQLIHYIRTKYRYGEIIVKTRDGQPYLITKTVEYTALDS